MAGADLELVGITKRFPGFTAIENLDLVIPAGSFFALLGPSGCGKTTTLRLVAGLEDPTAGRILIGGKDVTQTKPFQRPVNTVFQSYALFPHMTVLENVAFGPRSVGVRAAAARREAGQWLERFAISELAARRPGQLSGGQAQQVALARALAASPELLLLDEPLAALDVEVRAEVRAELAHHLSDWGGLAIVVTHSFDDVAGLAADVVVVEQGRATQSGTVRDLVRQPATPYISRLVAAYGED